MFYIKLDHISAGKTEYWTGNGWTDKLIMRKLYKDQKLVETAYQDKRISRLARMCALR